MLHRVVHCADHHKVIAHGSLHAKHKKYDAGSRAELIYFWREMARLPLRWQTPEVSSYGSYFHVLLVPSLFLRFARPGRSKVERTGLDTSTFVRAKLVKVFYDFLSCALSLSFIT